MPYHHAMPDVPNISQQAISAAVDEALTRVLPGDLGAQPRVARAVIAERMSAVAKHRSRDEVTAARDEDGVSWEDIGRAFGVSPQDARQHFGPQPSGLPE